MKNQESPFQAHVNFSLFWSIISYAAPCMLTHAVDPLVLAFYHLAVVPDDIISVDTSVLPVLACPEPIHTQALSQVSEWPAVAVRIMPTLWPQSWHHFHSNCRPLRVGTEATQCTVTHHKETRVSSLSSVTTGKPGQFQCHKTLDHNAVKHFFVHWCQNYSPNSTLGVRIKLL